MRLRAYDRPARPITLAATKPRNPVIQAAIKGYGTLYGQRHEDKRARRLSLNVSDSNGSTTTSRSVRSASGRTLPSSTPIRRSCSVHGAIQSSPLAQSVEHTLDKRGVGNSNLPRATS